jgi:hypothetical protein
MSTPMEQFLKVREIWRNVMNKREQMNQKAIELLSHPDTEPKHLIELHGATVRVEELMRDAVTSLRKRYPPSTGMLGQTNRPWNMPLYDKYDQNLRAKEQACTSS